MNLRGHLAHWRGSQTCRWGGTDWERIPQAPAPVTSLKRRVYFLPQNMPKMPFLKQKKYKTMWKPSFPHWREAPGVIFSVGGESMKTQTRWGACCEALWPGGGGNMDRQKTRRNKHGTKKRKIFAKTEKHGDIFEPHSVSMRGDILLGLCRMLVAVLKVLLRLPLQVADNTAHSGPVQLPARRTRRCWPALPVDCRQFCFCVGLCFASVKSLGGRHMTWALERHDPPPKKRKCEFAKNEKTDRNGKERHMCFCPPPALQARNIGVCLQ